MEEIHEHLAKLQEQLNRLHEPFAAEAPRDFEEHVKLYTQSRRRVMDLIGLAYQTETALRKWDIDVRKAQAQQYWDSWFPNMLSTTVPEPFHEDVTTIATALAANDYFDPSPERCQRVWKKHMDFITENPQWKLVTTSSPVRISSGSVQLRYSSGEFVTDLIISTIDTPPAEEKGKNN